MTEIKKGMIRFDPVDGEMALVLNWNEEYEEWNTLSLTDHRKELNFWTWADETLSKHYLSPEQYVEHLKERKENKQ